MKTLACALLLLALAGPVLAVDEGIGHVQTLQGNVWIERDGQRLAVAPGAEIRRGDLVRTGAPGAVGIVLSDHSSISLGSGSALAFDTYDFDPREGRFALVMRMVKGSFAYLSGLIGKLSPESIRLKVPDATIAVRGTKLLVEVPE